MNRILAYRDDVTMIMEEKRKLYLFVSRIETMSDFILR